MRRSRQLSIIGVESCASLTRAMCPLGTRGKPHIVSVMKAILDVDRRFIRRVRRLSAIVKDI
jgi:hypothetical protein